MLKSLPALSFPFSALFLLAHLCTFSCIRNAVVIDSQTKSVQETQTFSSDIVVLRIIFVLSDSQVRLSCVSELPRGKGRNSSRPDQSSHSSHKVCDATRCSRCNHLPLVLPPALTPQSYCIISVCVIW